MFPGRPWAGTSGQVSGFVRDKETGNALPGASVIVENTSFGSTADKYGFYIIYNLPVGNYSLRATMIGYVPTKVTDVEVKTDLSTPVNFSLVAQVLQVEQEIVVTAPRIEIYKDISASVHYIDDQALSVTLPVQTFQEALSLSPGFVANHFRGGRSASTLYLIDDMPASSPLTRDLAFMVPNSGIAEMVVQTGGFNAEYGNVSAGLVNIITKEGRNAFQGMAKLSTDILSWKEHGFENTRHAEFAMSGPLTIGLGGPVIDANYLICGGLNLSDTPNHEAMRHAFKFPILFNYDLNAKLAIHASRNLYLQWQTLVTDYDWRRYDSQWDDRVSALPKRKNRDLRTSLSLTHTLNTSTFYKLNLVGMELQRNVLGDSTAAGAPNNLSLANQYVAEAWPGATVPWNEQSHEKQLTAHFKFLHQINSTHQIKLGVQADLWDLQLKRTRYLLWPNSLSKTSQFVYSRYVDSYRHYPYNVAGYFQHKIELSGFWAYWGVRYELFASRAKQRDLNAVFSNSSDSVATVAVSKSHAHATFAPRFGLALPIGDVEHLSFNYGWFYEQPPLYYLYLNNEAAQDAFWPILGNVNLEPMRAVAWELTYRRAVSPQSIFSITGYMRDYQKLLDTLPYGENMPALVDDPATIFRYENIGIAKTSGLEMEYRRNWGRGLTSTTAYTYSRSVGTASWPESNFLNLARGELPNGRLLFPLAWDQRQCLTLNLGYQNPASEWLVNLLAQINGPATATTWLTNEGINLPWRYNLDLKIAASWRWGDMRLQPFLEIHNLLDERYLTPGEGGLDLSEPLDQTMHALGRQILVGIMYR